MAGSDREQAQRRRADARERRRKQSSGGRNDRPDASTTRDDGEIGEEPLAAVKQAAKVAAAGAAVGAAAAAARALGKHDEAEEEGEQEPRTHAAPETNEPKARVEEEEQQDQPEREPRPQAAQTDERPVQREQRPEPEDERPPGASADEAGQVVRQAREQLEALLGRSPESVSAMERTHDGWLVTVEVVEVSRVPESTDVLGSYEIELDEDRNLRRYARVRRYHRSQADQGGSP
jgi:hypothetical protein